MDLLEEERCLSDVEIARKVHLQEEFWRLAKLNESFLIQKSRASWANEGDCKSKLFHSIINWRRRKNSLKGLNVKGSWIEET